MPVPLKTLLISILSFGREANIISQLTDLPRWLADFSGQTGISIHIVVRNNDPGCDFAEVADRMALISAEFPSIACTLITNVPNNGFGAGHNRNIAVAPSDYVLILNDDIGFPQINFLTEAVSILQSDPRTLCVGARENPSHINALFGNGVLPGNFHLHTLIYAEASILLVDRRGFEALGGFNPDFAWAMCEDSDFSFRVQQYGYRIAHIAIPHEHWRSSSFNTLPAPVKSTILEHNRAAFFANWRETLRSGRIGRTEIFDLWSDGLGDVFCALPHLYARLAPLNAQLRENILVNTSHPELFAWLGLAGVRVASSRDLDHLRAELEPEGVATVRSMRDANFSLPFNLHSLLPGALGIEAAAPAMLAQFAALLKKLAFPAHKLKFAPGSYCVVHLEFDRNHQGRALAPEASADLLTIIGTLFERIVLIGREHRLKGTLFGASTAQIIDLQGQLSLTQLGAILARAEHFIGIDSFPAHVAQAAGAKCAIFSGAVHPLTRSWNENSVWPLVADLECIGCYHTHLEASVPFCMRRDQACASALSQSAMRAILQDMIAGTAFDWHRQRLRLQSLQAKMIKLARHHPAPPDRLFKPAAATNEAMSEMVYKISDMMGHLLGNTYHCATITALNFRTEELQSELYAAKIALGEAARAAQSAQSRQLIAAQPHATQIVQLNKIPLETYRCSAQITDQWIEIHAFEEDPQIYLPPVQGKGGKLQLRLSYIADSPNALQIYWAIGDAPFSTDQVLTLVASGALEAANLTLEVADGKFLRIRIDPTTGIGHSRLRGSLGGMFALAAPAMCADAAPPPILGAAAEIKSRGRARRARA